jgi:hypothetical protein
MSLGITPTKTDIDLFAGAVARRVNEDTRLAGALKYFLDSKTVGDLEALGYTAAEANALKSAAADLDQLRSIYEGGSDLLAPKDFRAFARQLFGFGTGLPGN